MEDFTKAKGPRGHYPKGFVPDKLKSWFKTCPNKMLTPNEVAQRFGFTVSAASQHLQRLKAEKFITMPEFGKYQFNKDYETPEEITQRALEVGRQRVVQSDRQWSATQPVITGTIPDPTYRIKFVKHIISRMKDSAFTTMEVEIIEDHLRDLEKSLPKNGSQPVTPTNGNSNGHTNGKTLVTTR